MYSNFFQPSIILPTRCLPNYKPSLIDNIFTNCLDKKVISGNITDIVSDHMPNFLFINSSVPPKSKTKHFYRDCSHLCPTRLNQEVQELELLPSEDINLVFNDFQSKFINIINKHAPWKKLLNSEEAWKQKPWITKGIQKSIQKKNLFYGKFVRTKSTHWYNRYKEYRNNIRRLTLIAKKQHFSNYFDIFKQNSKKIWAGINNIIQKSMKSTNEDIYLFDENKNTITNQQKVASMFNKFYTSVADSLVSKLGNCDNKFQDFLNNPNAHSMFLKETDRHEIFDILKNLDSNKATDIFGISPKFLHMTAESLSPFLSYIFNLSFKSGVFPDNMNIAKVIPIFKSGSKLEVSNHRPISLLPIFSKVFEKLVHSRLFK